MEMMLIVGRRFVTGVVGTTMAVAFDVAVPERLSLRAVTSATSHPVAVRRSRKPSCASTEVGTELCVSS